MDTSEEYPNYIWYYYEGTIIAKPETPDEPTHMDAFPFLADQDERMYKGRYDSRLNTITIIKPIGARDFTEIPYAVEMELKNKFGRDAKILEF